MVRTRASQQPAGEQGLLVALLSGNGALGKRLLRDHPSVAAQCGPSGFTALHAAALTDQHRLVPDLVAAGVSPSTQIEALDGPAAYALRKWMQELSRLPSNKLCAVFRGESQWLHWCREQSCLQAGLDV